MPDALCYDVLPPEQEAPLFAAPIDEPTAPPKRRETIYVTMSNKDPRRRIHWRDGGNIVMACVAIAMLLPLVFSPEVPTYTTKMLTVPAILLPVQIITVSVSVIPTGVTTYPAKAASGVLTITNGGSLSQSIQAGFLLTSSSGVEVSTDYGVTVPAGNGESYGSATVSAHAVAAGSNGNIPAYSINRTYGTDIFVKNTSAFSGGQDSYSVQYMTDQDKQTALNSATSQVEAKQPLVLLLKPCTETTGVQNNTASATLTCQPITYHAPAHSKVMCVRVKGKSVVLTYKVRINADV